MHFTTEWRCCSMHDPSGRRGVWYRTLPDGRLEIRAGREGDDACSFIPAELAESVDNCLSYGAWMQEDYGPNAMEATYELVTEADEPVIREATDA